MLYFAFVGTNAVHVRKIVRKIVSIEHFCVALFCIEILFLKLAMRVEKIIFL